LRKTNSDKTFSMISSNADSGEKFNAQISRQNAKAFKLENQIYDLLRDYLKEVEMRHYAINKGKREIK
jgi:hypothetical protein